MSLKRLQINIRQMLQISSAFVFFTIVGTLTHELGHIVVAEYYGYETTLHYGSMSYTSADYKEVLRIYSEHGKSIENDLPFDGQDEYEQLSKKIQKEELLIFIGGPLQTMLTGLIGLGLLRWRRNQIQEGALSLVDWILVFLALFWLREVFNLSTHLLFGLINDTGYLFGGDEAFISSSLKLWPGTIPFSSDLWEHAFQCM